MKSCWFVTDCIIVQFLVHINHKILASYCQESPELIFSLFSSV
jgi:hypothetical protein